MPEPDPVVDAVLAFLNTVDVEAGTDEFAEDASFQAWARTRPELTDLDLGSSADSLPTARELRTRLRARALGEPGDGTVELPVRVVLDGADAPTLAAADVVGRLAAAVITLALAGRLDRIKICPADDCRVAFYDRSRNGSRQWCSMQVCGNRAKARNHRLRASGN